MTRAVENDALNQIRRTKSERSTTVARIGRSIHSQAARRYPQNAVPLSSKLHQTIGHMKTERYFHHASSLQSQRFPDSFINHVRPQTLRGRLRSPRLQLPPLCQLRSLHLSFHFRSRYVSRQYRVLLSHWQLRAAPTVEQPTEESRYR